MRYWGLFIAKMIAAAAALKAIWVLMTCVLPPPRITYRGSFFGYDLWWTFFAGWFLLLCCGALFLVVWDQRYRCRVCARRLRMPITAGSWSRMLQFGRPRLDYICPYGHGTLRVPELHFNGRESDDWTRHQDIWQELYSLDEPRR